LISGCDLFERLSWMMKIEYKNERLSSPGCCGLGDNWHERSPPSTCQDKTMVNGQLCDQMPMVKGVMTTTSGNGVVTMVTTL
jgi:hypothetical protein